MSTDPDRARTLRRRHMHERQAVIFGVLLAALAVAGLGAAAVYTGTLGVPSLSRGFSSPAPAAGVTAPPCPPEGAAPVPYAQVTVNVFNGAKVLGLAAQTATALTSRGFVVATTANSSETVTGTARIRFGAAGVAAAYTLAAQLSAAVLVLDARADATVDITVGTGYTGLIAADAITLDPAVPFAAPTGCVPISQITLPPPPTATGAATEAPPQDGAETPAPPATPATG
ncbi:LytR C-terminal domain-containing protein [Cellulomonas sp.]|uniref:LytR C-terminal domain-containing protein n=1 Tax=Cellulomonas sp. TaxID=40001 RepID=UPI0025BE77D4|nr:LytR C-terminal domain-containing protein [Cellulomonas sp.]